MILKKKWFIVTLPIKNIEKKFGEAVRRGCLKTDISSSAIEHYFPMVKSIGNWGEITEFELYEGYGFICLPSNINSYFFFQEFDDKMNSLWVIRKIVKVGDLQGKMVDIYIPAEVEEYVIDTTKIICKNYSEKICKYTFKINQHVRIIKGAFCDFLGTISFIDYLEQVIFVNIFFLGREISIRADIDDLLILGEKNVNKDK